MKSWIRTLRASIFPINYLRARFSAGFLLALLTFLVYLNTLAPGVYGLDRAELATGVSTMGIVHPPGYPIYILLGRLFSLLPFGDIAYRLNLMSAVFGSLTIMWVYKIIHKLIGNMKFALAAAAIFAASNYFWTMALLAEVYTLHTFFLALNIWWLLKWREYGTNKYLYGFVYTFGLSLTNHTSSILFTFGFVWLIFSSPFWKWRNVSMIVRMSGLFLIGLIPYIYLPLSVGANPSLNYIETYYGVDLLKLKGLWWMISGQAYRIFAFGYSLDQIPGEVYRFIGYLWRNYLGVGAIIGIFGIPLFWRRDRNSLISLMLIFGGNMIFFVNYRVIDKDTMFLPAFLVWAILISWGMQAAMTQWNRLITRKLLLPKARSAMPVMFFLIPILAFVFNWNWVDKSEEYGPQHFAERVLSTTDQNALIVAPWSSAVILEYYQIVLGKRPDITIYNRSRTQVAEYYIGWKEGNTDKDIWLAVHATERRMIDSEIKQRAVYVVEYEPRYAHSYEFIPEKSIFKLKPIKLLDFVHKDS